MKGALYIIFSLFMILSLKSQTIVKDTVYITKGNMSHLIFTDQPEHTDFGSGYIASGNDGAPAVKQVGDTWIIIIKAKKKFKNATNISVITDTQVYYDITCMYSEEKAENFKTFDYGNPIKNAYENKKVKVLGNPSKDEEDVFVLSAEQKDSIIEVERKIYYTDSVRYKGQAKRLYSSKGKQAKRIGSRNEKITLSLRGTYARKDKIYIKVSIYNGASLPFDIDKWDFFYANSGGFNIETSPKQSVKPIYEYNSKYQSVIPLKSQIKVFVFDDFSISKEHNFFIQLFEKNGERDIVLSFDSKLINNAKVIKDSYR